MKKQEVKAIKTLIELKELVSDYEVVEGTAKQFNTKGQCLVHYTRKSYDKDKQFAKVSRVIKGTYEVTPEIEVETSTNVYEIDVEKLKRYCEKLAGRVLREVREQEESIYSLNLKKRELDKRKDKYEKQILSKRELVEMLLSE